MNDGEGEAHRNCGINGIAALQQDLLADLTRDRTPRDDQSLRSFDDPGLTRIPGRCYTANRRGSGRCTRPRAGRRNRDQRQQQTGSAYLQGTSVKELNGGAELPGASDFP